MNRVIAIAAKTATPPTTPPTIAPIGPEDFFDPEPPVTDPAEDGLAPDDCMITVDVSEYDAAVAAMDVAVLVTVAEITSETPTLLQTAIASALASAMSALEHVASMQEAMLCI